jgi:hypothetical protein
VYAQNVRSTIVVQEEMLQLSDPERHPGHINRDVHLKTLELTDMVITIQKAHNRAP